MLIEIPDQTVRDVQAMLVKRGKNGDVSQFIDQTVQRALFFDVVREIKRQNADADPDELDRLIEESVKAVRTERSRTPPDANGA